MSTMILACAIARERCSFCVIMTSTARDSTPLSVPSWSRSAGGSAQLHGDDDVGIHFAHRFTGMFCTMPPSASTRPSISTGVNTPGNGHRGAHRLGQRTVAQDHGFSADHIGGDAAERNGQVVEVGDAGLGQGDAIEQKSHAVAGIESVGAAQSVFQAEAGVDQKVAAILLAAIGEIAESRLGRKASSQSIFSANSRISAGDMPVAYIAQ